MPRKALTILSVVGLLLSMGPWATQCSFGLQLVLLK